MKERIRRLILAVVLTIGASLEGGLCHLEKNETFLLVDYWSYRTNHFWNKNGKRRDAFNHFKEDAVRGYIGYGLTCRDTLTLQANWARADETMHGTRFGVSDIELGWTRYLGQKWCHDIYSRVIAIIPSESKYEPPIRYGRWGGEFDLFARKEIACSWWDGWYEFGVGYRLYEGFPSDQLRAEARLAYRITSKWSLIGETKLEYGVFNGKEQPKKSLILFNPNYRLLKAQVETVYSVCRYFSLRTGGFVHVWGENVGTGGGWFGGFAVDF